MRSQHHDSEPTPAPTTQIPRHSIPYYVPYNRSVSHSLILLVAVVIAIVVVGEINSLRVFGRIPARLSPGYRLCIFLSQSVLLQLVLVT